MKPITLALAIWLTQSQSPPPYTYRLYPYGSEHYRIPGQPPTERRLYRGESDHPKRRYSPDHGYRRGYPDYTLSPRERGL